VDANASSCCRNVFFGPSAAFSGETAARNVSPSAFSPRALWKRASADTEVSESTFLQTLRNVPSTSTTAKCHAPSSIVAITFGLSCALIASSASSPSPSPCIFLPARYMLTSEAAACVFVLTAWPRARIASPAPPSFL